MYERHKVGVVRAVCGNISPKEQVARLTAFGVEDSDIWYEGSHSVREIAAAYDPSKDILVVACACVLSDDWLAILDTLESKSILLYDLEERAEVEVTRGPTFRKVSKRA